MLRHGGYSPSPWVLGKTPRGPPSLMEEDNSADLGSLQDQADPESRFALIHHARAEAKKIFRRLETSNSVQRALCVQYLIYILRRICSLFQAYRLYLKEPKTRAYGSFAKAFRILVSARHLRPAQDAEALARAVLHGEPVLHDDSSPRTARVRRPYRRTSRGRRRGGRTAGTERRF